jgi:hypothetical protein
VILILLALGAATTALAQTITADQKAACRADYGRFCRGTMPDGGSIVARLAKQHDKLAGPCECAVTDAQRK